MLCSLIIKKWLIQLVSGIIDIRLVGGSSVREGRVEVLFNGEWGTVCDDMWGLEDASVVCRQLGYRGADEAFQSARFGEGIDPILLDNVQCVGTEASLNDCSKNDIGDHNCGHHEDAGVVCSNPGQSIKYTKSHFNLQW